MGKGGADKAKKGKKDAQTKKRNVFEGGGMTLDVWPNDP